MAEKLFYSMGEVAEMLDVNASLIRYWGTQFPSLKPQRNKKGNRLFSPADVAMLKRIYHYVKERGMTLEGAKKALRGDKAAMHSQNSDAELLKRLHALRSMLLAVRESLGGDADTTIVVEPETEQIVAKVVEQAPEVKATVPEPVVEVVPEPVVEVVSEPTIEVEVKTEPEVVVEEEPVVEPPKHPVYREQTLFDF